MRIALNLAACAALLMLMGQSATADPCREAFMKVKTDSKPKGPIRSRSISLTNGKNPSTSMHLSNGAGDWMTHPTAPSVGPWSLEVGKVLYVSSDQGKTWTKARDMNDPGHDPEVVRKEVADAAAAATNLTCGTDEMDGLRHETFEADIVYPKMNMTTREKLWLHPETRRVVKSHMIMRMSGMEVETTQFTEYLPELTLPKP